MPKMKANANSNTPAVDAEFRKRSWIKVGIGVVGFALVLGLFFLIGMIYGYAPVNPFKMIPLCIPFVYLCIGLIEVVSGQPYSHLAAAWMSLKGWQRGIIGTIIIIASLVFIMLGVAFVFTYLVR